MSDSQFGVLMFVLGACAGYVLSQIPGAVRMLTSTTSPRLSDDDFALYLSSLGIKPESSVKEWRCRACHQMQRGESLCVWIPDGTLKGDPLWAVLTQCRRLAYNGQFSAWCLSCCRGFMPMSADEMARAGNTPHDPIPTITVRTD